MYLKRITRKNGSVTLAIYESYSENGKSRNRCVETLGKLDELDKIYGDATAHFLKEVEKRNEEQKTKKTLSIDIDLNATLDSGEHNLMNCGYGICKQIYMDLKIPAFWLWKTRGRQIEYSVDQIFRLLTFGRIIRPASKKSTFENQNLFFESFDDFSDDDMYHALDIMAENAEALQAWMFDKSKAIRERDLSSAYFDCTNYYFDIGAPYTDNLDENGNVVDKNGKLAKPHYQKRGPEKNKRPDPIVEMGLLMDRNGLPIAYELFPGNESEKIHMRPMLNRVKNKYCNTGTRIIVVADRGLNTADNIYWLNGDNKGDENTRDGYVYGQSVRGASAEFKTWVLDQTGYVNEKILQEDGTSVQFKHKSRIEVKDIFVNITDTDGKKKKKKVNIDQKQMVYYSEKYAKKQRRDRNVMIERAKDLIHYPKKYDRVTAAGSAAYVLNIAFNQTTGEIVEDRELLLDIEKIQEEEKYDGYYSIVTSELTMTDKEIRDVYRGLSRIEDTFKKTKSSLEARPIYLRTRDHINAHFLICFTALLIMRLLELQLERKFTFDQILNSLRNYCCTRIDANCYQFLYYDEIMKACGVLFKEDFNRKYRTREEIRRMLRY